LCEKKKKRLFESTNEMRGKDNDRISKYDSEGASSMNNGVIMKNESMVGERKLINRVSD
jgi:hypothetical protein